MPTVTAVHILLDNANDPVGSARRHIGRRVGQQSKQSDIVRDAWVQRNAPSGNAISSTSINAPPFTAVEIYYDPNVTSGASELEVIDALIKAGNR
jgi:hypothetical protein